MALLSDGLYGLTITPHWSGNWWSYDFELSHNGQPFLNPKIVKSNVFKGDEYDRDEKEYNHLLLISVLETASKATNDEETFGWQAWETEVEVEIKPQRISAHNRIADTNKYEHHTGICFNFSVLIGETFFVDGETNYGHQNRGGISLFISQDDLKKFYLDLKSEMEKIGAPLFRNK